MNLFKKYYPIIKKELKRHKEAPAAADADGAERCNTLEKLRSALDACKWNMLICRYLDMCDDEEKKFIDLLYFKDNPICDVGLLFPLSIRACQEWREEILKNLVLLAAKEGLIEIQPFMRPD